MRQRRSGWFLLLAAAALLFGLTRLPHGPRSAPAPSSRPPAAATPKVDLLRAPLAFEPNTGRWDRGIDYLARGAGYGLALSGGDARLSLQRGKQATQVTMRLEGARRQRPAAERALAGRINYCLGHDRSHWRTGVPTYGQVRYRGVYEGVDLVYYGNQGQLEYDFRVRPHVDPKQIALRFDGAGRLALDDEGNLQVRAGGGSVSFHRPVVYQEQGGRRQYVEARYELAGTRVAFAVGEYDRSRELVIDPVLVYARYLGGAGGDEGNGVAVDPAGNAYVTGRTQSTQFAGVTGVHGGYDAFVVKLDSAGNQVWATYVGGAGDDSARGIAVDAAGHACIAGDTASPGFPGALNAMHGARDAFVAQLDAAGIVTWSTYLGGTSVDVGQAIALDTTGNAYVAGATASTDFAGASNSNRGIQDAFVAKLSSSGSLTWACYLGGSGISQGPGVVVDATGNVYVSGQTDAANFAGTTGGLHGGADGFVTKLSNSGSLSWVRFLGGTGNDGATGITIDGTGDLYVTGSAASTNFAGASNSNHGNADAFVAKLSSAGTVTWATLLGGTGNESGYGVAVDTTGYIYAAGLTVSTDFAGATNICPGGQDAFYAELDSSGSVTSTAYVGGSRLETSYGLALDNAGRVHIAGTTTSADFAGASGGYGGATDAFVARLDTHLTAVTTTADSGPGSLRSTITFANNHPGPDTIVFAIPGGGVQTISPLSALPAITETVTIDGYSQPGSSVNTATVGTNAQLKVVLDGSLAGLGTHGLALHSSSSLVRGLVLAHWVGAGVELMGTGNTVSGCFVGCDATGATAAGNRMGILVEGGDANTIGGANLADRNLVGGSAYYGVWVIGAGANNRVAGNLIGVTRAGTAVLANGSDGVGVMTSPSTTVGGTLAPGASPGDPPGNVIAGSAGDGVSLTDCGGSLCQGNLIGVGADGTTALGNSGSGVRVRAVGVTIGGIGVGQANVIANNTGYGVLVDSGSRESILGNRLYANAGGIRLVCTSVNGGIAAPTLRLVTVSSGQPTITWAWTGAQTAPYRVEFFTNPAGAHVEGRTYLGCATPTSISGVQATTLAGPVGATDLLTATITDADGNTSALSAAMAVADHLVVTQQPANGTVHSTLPAVKVAVGDSAGATITNAVADLGLALLNNPSAATLTGTTSHPVVSGVATFDDLQLDKVGAGYTCRVTSSPLTGADTTGFNVGAGTVSAAHTTAAVPAGIAGSVTTITVTARDVYDNARASGGDAVAATVTGTNAGKTVTVVDNANGTYTLTYTPTTNGSDTIAITLGGSAINGSPFTSSVAIGAASASHSTAAVPAGTAGSVTTITVTARDACDNARAAGGDTVSATITGANAGKPVVVLDNTDSTYTLTYTPTTSGTDTIAITLGGTAISGSPFSSSIGPGAVSATHSTAVVPAGTAGLVTTITVTARDACDNARSSGGDTVAASVTGANAGKPVTVTDNTDGTYTLTYTPTTTGTDTLAVTLGGAGIGGSPFTSVVAPGAPSAADSTATVPGGTAGSATHVLIQLRDAHHNHLMAGGAAVAVSVTGANTATATVTDNGDGTYTAGYTPTVAGADSLAITLGGSAISGSPYASIVAPAGTTGSASTATVPAGTAGAVTTIAIQSRDSFGNPRTVGGDTVAVLVSGANTATGTVTDHGDGTYTAAYTPVRSGTDHLTITVGGAGIVGSPFTTLVSAGATSAGTSTALVPGGTTGAVTTITIQAKDACGNPRPTGGDVVAVTVAGANDGATVAVDDHGNGTYTATYTPTHAGSDAIAITLGGAPLGGSPYASTVVPAATDPAHCAADVPAGLAGQPTHLTVTVRDAFGNLRGSGGDTLAATVTGANTATATVTDHGDGTYDLSYTPTHAGSDAIALTLGGVALGGSPYTSTVAPAATDPAHCAADVPAGRAGQATALVVRVRDAFDNLRTAGGDPVAIAITGANPATPTVTGNHDGSYTASYTPTHAGSDQVAVTVGGTAIAGSPFRTVVAPGAVDAGQSSFAADRTAAAADGSQPVTLSLVLRDGWQNPLPGVPPSDLAFTADPADGVTVTAPTAASDEGGALTATVTGTKAQAVTLSVTARGVTLAATLSIRFRPHFQVTLPAGRQFVGLPFSPGDPSPEAVLGSSAAVLKRWRPELGDYALHQPGDADPDGFFAFGPGRGLWLAPKAPLTLDLLGEPTPAGAFTFDLPVGWSNLANPFDRDLPWNLEQITVLVGGQPRGTLADPRLWDTVRPYLWLWNNEAGKAWPLFPPFTQSSVPRLAGCWARALVEGVQLVVGQPAASRARTRAASPGDWQLQVTAQQGAAQATALVGVHGSLTRSLPVDAPPTASEVPLRLEVVQPGGGRAAGELRPSADGNGSWELAVTSAADGEVTLAWPSLLRSLPRGLVMTLQDLTSGTSCLLNTHGSYRYTGTRGERRLKLSCRLGHLERSEVTALAAVPTRGGGLSLTLNLTGPAELTLSVRGLGGQLVKTLQATVAAAGSVSLSWDGTDQSGRPVPAGTYQVTAAAQGPNGAVSRAVRTVTVR